MYDPVTRKVIINQDVQFVENEAWDGKIEKIVSIINSIKHDETEEKVIKKPCTSHFAVPSTPRTVMQITMKNTPVISTGA
jgi:hypothetical protein